MLTLACIPWAHDQGSSKRNMKVLKKILKIWKVSIKMGKSSCNNLSFMEMATSCRGPNLLNKNNGNICARHCVKTTITSVKLACMFT